MLSRKVSFTTELSVLANSRIDLSNQPPSASHTRTLISSELNKDVRQSNQLLRTLHRSRLMFAIRGLLLSLMFSEIRKEL